MLKNSLTYFSKLSKAKSLVYSSILKPASYTNFKYAYCTTPEKPKDFKIEQIFTGCLAEFTYYIESNGEAVIIDPLRDITPYLELAEKNNAKIKYVMETHFHADFVSGHVELAQKTGSKIVYGPNATPKFDAHIAKDGEELKVGNITLKVLHTPGHTLESSCFLLFDEQKKPYSIFTGDTLFLGEVGRPDLAVKGESITKEDLAGMMYDSLRQKILPLPDDVLVYPTHGAGSACGKAISKGKVDTLGNQKKFNYALKPMDKDEFIKIVSSDLAPPPKYFFRDVTINREGSKSYEDILRESAVPLKMNEFQEKLKKGSVILDCRDGAEYAEGYIPGSINVSLKMPFAVWAASLLDLNASIVLITEPGKEAEAVTRLARVGFEGVDGYLEGGIETWVESGKKLESMNIIPPSEFKDKLSQNINVIDVRNPDEWKLGVIKGAKLIPLTKLLDNLTGLDRNQPYYLYCKVGGRSQIAYSLLKKLGFSKLYSVKGGMDRIMSEGVELSQP